MSNIHKSSVIEDGAKIGKNVVIGPFCHVGPQVTLQDNVELLSHVAVHGDTNVGAGTRIFPHASVGHIAQDLKYSGEPSKIELGENCIVRECVTINGGTAGGGSLTRIGNNCAFLACSHVGHDCLLGNNIIFSNNVMLAGHCIVGDHVIVGGGAGIHQFVRIGHHAFIGGMSGVENDLIPFGLAIGNRAELGGLNLVGMKRSGMARESIHAMRNSYKTLFDREGTIKDNAAEVEKTYGEDPHVADLMAFVNEKSDRSLCVPRIVANG